MSEQYNDRIVITDNTYKASQIITLPPETAHKRHEVWDLIFLIASKLNHDLTMGDLDNAVNCLIDCIVKEVKEEVEKEQTS
jgi:hypothetical protein